MTNKEKFNQLFEETFGVSAFSVFELECTCTGKCPHYNDEHFECVQCEYDTRNFWKQEYTEEIKACKNCKYFESYDRPSFPRTDGSCNKLRSTQVGFLAINVHEDHLCSLYVKKGTE